MLGYCAFGPAQGVEQRLSYVWTFSLPKFWEGILKKIGDFSGFFSDFGGESLFLGQKWGLACQLAGHGRYGQDKNVEK